jgi:hypothetical protein
MTGEMEIEVSQGRKGNVRSADGRTSTNNRVPTLDLLQSIFDLARKHPALLNVVVVGATKQEGRPVSTARREAGRKRERRGRSTHCVKSQ